MDDQHAQLDKAIRATMKSFKQVSAIEVWTWATNREGDLVGIEDRMKSLAGAGRLKSVANSFPAAYKMGRWR